MLYYFPLVLLYLGLLYFAFGVVAVVPDPGLIVKAIFRFADLVPWYVSYVVSRLSE